VLIVDFGSQVTQLIARRVREAGVYCEIAPFQSAEKAFAELKPKAIILSGGPCSVTDEGSPRAPQAIFEAGIPVLGICYGEQTMAEQLGGKVEAGHHREFGRAELEIVEASALFEGVWDVGKRYPVWMSHGDRVTVLPAGFKRIAISENAPLAAIADDQGSSYVWVVDAQQKAVYRPVELVPLLDGLRIIRKGLSPNERIIVEGLMAVRNGMPVQPKEVDMKLASPQPVPESPAGSDATTPPAPK
jgi:GMP synthase (glutamine-hydrolysing) A subunit